METEVGEPRPSAKPSTLVTCTEIESVHAAMDGLLVFAVRLHYVFVVCLVDTIE